MTRIDKGETALAEVLRPVETEPTVARYRDTAVRLSDVSGELEPAKVALVASFTIEPLVPFLRVEAARLGYEASVYTGPFNAWHQELRDPSRGCVSSHPELVVVAPLLEDASPDLAHRYLSLGRAEATRVVDETCEELMASVKAFRAHSAATVVVHGFACPPPALGIYEPMVPDSRTWAVRELNQRMSAAARGVPDVYVLDFDRVCAAVGYDRWRDDRLWHMGRMPLSASMMPALAREQARFLHAVKGTPRKCLVVDLDDTLWGGVVGEDGVTGIALGPTYPGSVFVEFQRALVELHDRGVLLAICSKNNESDVDEVFASHPHMVLTRDHFAAARVNWRDKPGNLQDIAAELNIGIESLVFFDDNPVERELMRQVVPDVATVEVPRDPMRYCEVLRGCAAFDRLGYTAEDRHRTTMYHAERERRTLRDGASSVEDFLVSLRMRVSVTEADEFALARVADLVGKTNQFNLTTRRRSQAELAQLAEHPDHGVFAVQLTDRFGDQGVVGVIILSLADEVAEIDTFLLSCRALGRQVETAMLAHVAEWARGRGAVALEGDLIETKKNQPSRGFYEAHALHQVSEDGPRSRWRLDLGDGVVRWPSTIQAA